jgi:hypothetical protein
MTPLRDKFIRAREAYENARYPGNLAGDVMPERRAGNGPRWVMAIAAAVAVMTASAYVVTRLSAPASAPEEVVVHPEPSVPQAPVSPDQPGLDPTNILPPQPALAANDPEAADGEDDAFTLVPTLETFADASQAGTAMPMNLTLSVPESPMLFSLSALSEQSSVESSVESNQDENEPENRS